MFETKPPTALATEGEKPKALVFSPRLDTIGGGTGVAAWAAQALSLDYQVTLLARRPIDLAVLDRAFGTRLCSSDVEAKRFGWLPTDPLPFQLALLEQHLTSRHVRRTAPKFQLIFANANETDIGVPCVQYIHFPWSFLPRPDAVHWYHKSNTLLGLYRAGCAWLSGFDTTKLDQNLTFTNSQWTLDKLRSWTRPDFPASVLPPPIAIQRSATTFAQRENAVLMVGRLSKEKRVEVAIDVVERLRERGQDLSLTLVGPVDDQEYASRVIDRVSSLPWATYHENISRSALENLMAQHRYGFHAMIDEHFGMAVAEMLRAGCVVFAHNSGGPREILDGNRELLYDDEEQAITKFEAILSNPSAQQRAAQWSNERGQCYSSDRFESDLREQIRRWIAGRSSSS